MLATKLDGPLFLQRLSRYTGSREPVRTRRGRPGRAEALRVGPGVALPALRDALEELRRVEGGSVPPASAGGRRVEVHDRHSSDYLNPLELYTTRYLERPYTQYSAHYEHVELPKTPLYSADLFVSVRG